MKTWLVFDRRMEVIGTVRAEAYSQAFTLAMSRFRYVEYIQECWFPKGGVDNKKVFGIILEKKEKKMNIPAMELVYLLGLLSFCAFLTYTVHEVSNAINDYLNDF